jgi:hypothetical protein
LSPAPLSERLRLRGGLSATLHALPMACGALIAFHLLIHPLLPETPLGVHAAALFLSAPSAALAALLCGLALFWAGFHGARSAARRGLDCRPGEVAANLGGVLMWGPLTAPPAFGPWLWGALAASAIGAWTGAALGRRLPSRQAPTRIS